MASFIKNILKLSVFAIMLPTVVLGTQQSNPRAGTSSSGWGRSADSVSDASVRRAATSVIARSMNQNKRQTRAVVTARPATVRATSVRSARPVTSGGKVARSATKPSLVRSGVKQKIGSANISRAGVARATAVFNDVSKIGGGYAECRDSYATCMDQICANANDTYRRCFCSDRFREFQNTSDKIDEALKLLADFQNTNLDAVNKTAAEVNAMYSATAGEEAIKRDTSASQKLLDSISDILSGKKTTYVSKNIAPVTTSLGLLDFSSFSSGSGDVFSDSGSSVFNSTSVAGGSIGRSSYVELSSLEGADLYNAATQQCLQVSNDSCNGDAMSNLARSSYSILITQDCNAYEKSINAKKASLEDTVRTAEKYLREARLNEYRAHNSADINECLTAVDNAIRQPLVCGANYERCLDFTGLYINSTTGEPIFGSKGAGFFGLSNLIVLDGTSNVVGANADFVKEFEVYTKSHAESALDTCRGIADEVWEEYKRMAIIKIAQAQDDKIEEVKNNCVNVIKECYDTQTEQLVGLAGEVGKAETKAIATISAREQCQAQVFGCAALYGDIDGCSYDNGTGKISTVAGKKCGLQSLLAMVDALDSVKFAKGCEEGLRQYVETTCAPSPNDTEHEYPWGCRNWSPEQLREDMAVQAEVFCASDFQSDYSINDVRDANGNVVDNSGNKYGGKLALSASAQSVIDNIMKDVQVTMEVLLREECSKIKTEGTLVYDASGYSIDTSDSINVSPTWLTNVFGTATLQTLISAGVTGYNLQLRGETVKADGAPSFGWGICMMPSARQLCNMQSQIPGFKSTVEFVSGRCELKPEWFVQRCSAIGGYMSDGKCWFK